MGETMSTDHTTYREWLDLDLEGALPAGDGPRLAAHLTGCADCRAERQRLAVLHESLAAARVPVRAGFGDRVMASLPEAAWERPTAPAARWAWSVGLVGLLAAASAALFAVSGARLAPGGSLAGALGALAEMLAVAAIAGAGLLGATWTGLGMAVGELFGRSPGTLAAVALLALCLAVLTVSLLRRPRPARRRIDGDS
jgi:predicted anti-sigma-YlaC factor YlaD